jgi:4-amino-4-deoxy-L-arabinose transferase-like glycosyltransferase
MTDPSVLVSNRNSVPPLANRSFWLRAAILLGALALLFDGEFQIFRGVPSQVSSGGLVVMALGLVLLLAVIGSGMLNTVPDLALDASRIESGSVQIRFGWLGLSLVLTAWVMWRSTQRPVEAYLVEYVLVWSLAILTLAMAVLSSQKMGTTTADTRPFLRWEYAALLLLLVGSLAVRGINLGTVPALMDQDEAAFAQEGTALAITYHLQANPFEQGQYSYARGYELLIGISTLLFGKTLFAARLPAMLLGAFGVPAVYLLGRELFNRTVGLLAALFMLGWAYQAFFSRIALNQPGDPVFTTLAFYFLLRGLRRQQVIDFFMAGLTLAVAQLFYLGARVAPIVMVVFLLYLFIRQRPVMVKQWRLLAVMALIAVIVALPQHYWIFYFKQPFTTRLSEKSIFSVHFGATNSAWDQAVQDGTVPALIGHQVLYSLGGLFTTPDTGGWYGFGSNIMGAIGAPLLLIGALATLRVWWSRPRWTLPLLWGLAIVGSGSVLASNPPAYERYFPGVSAFSLLVAVGIWAVTLGAARIFDQPRIIKPLLTVLGLLVLIGNLAYFVFDYLPAAGYFRNLNNWLTNRVAAEMQTAVQAGRYVVLVGSFGQEVQNTPVLKYYMTGTPYTFLDTTVTDSLLSRIADSTIDYNKPLTYLVSASAENDLHQLKENFPEASIATAYLPEDHTLAFYIFNVNVAHF